MSALPIEVRPTQPPSQHVRVLGQDVCVGPAHLVYTTLALIYILGPVIGVQRQSTLVPITPELPDFASPLALVRLLPCAAIVTDRDITILDPSGAPQ